MGRTLDPRARRFRLVLPVGIRIGEDALRRLNAKPSELSVVF
jgi:hypothetical protein